MLRLTTYRNVHRNEGKSLSGIFNCGKITFLSIPMSNSKNFQWNHGYNLVSQKEL